MSYLFEQGDNVAFDQPRLQRDHKPSSAADAGHVLPVVSAIDTLDSGRERLEQYIAGIFHAAYGARILEYLPLLFSLDQEGATNAALGLRSASYAPLFCEQYLDTSVEDQVVALYGRQVGRDRIMELGNLVGSQPGQSALLYLLVVAALNEAGVEYLLFAANKAVRASITRSGFTPRVIQVAERNRLGSQKECWGTYYDGEPVVMLGDIRMTMGQIKAQPVMRQVLRAYRHSIPVLADSICTEVG
ncbi:MAG: hypothetical protein HOC23_18290 [Halieaceae bacterium]|jgi:hypothetical protein|nr:hypothetical protein [Halieaceae bacterium]